MFRKPPAGRGDKEAAFMQRPDILGESGELEHTMIIHTTGRPLTIDTPTCMWCIGFPAD